QDCQIPEYWIVDPQTKTILLLALEGDTYTEVGNFRNEELIQSSSFPELNLRVSEVFTGC
ncbi:MAG: Uma2 family endonuclease, partial [Microcystaceae cyanobacterium]